MNLCKEKKESIKSNTIAIYSLAKQWRKEGKIDDQEFTLLAVYLRKIEMCTNLDKTFREE